MAFDVLTNAGGPLHVNEILKRSRAPFSVELDRDSLVSSLSKKVARSDRFRRPAKNTFALIERPRRPLLDAFLAIVGPWRAVFPQQRAYRRTVRQALGSLVCSGRRPIQM